MQELQPGARKLTRLRKCLNGATHALCARFVVLALRLGNDVLRMSFEGGRGGRAQLATGTVVPKTC